MAWRVKLPGLLGCPRRRRGAIMAVLAPMAYRPAGGPFGAAHNGPLTTSDDK
jgi:hypothetical protein